jgi:hypothetical protein
VGIEVLEVVLVDIAQAQVFRLRQEILIQLRWAEVVRKSERLYLMELAAVTLLLLAHLFQKALLEQEQIP